MSKINIYEKDITLRRSPYDVTQNAVYIPGFAADGKAHEVTLYESVEAFQNTLGDKPYKFDSDQADYAYIKANTYDLSYVYARELLRLGMKVYYEAFSEGALGEDQKHSGAIKSLYAGIQDAFDLTKSKIADRNTYNIKFITTGAYQSFDVTNLPEAMLKLAATRGDCVAVIDYDKSKKSDPYSDITKIWTAVNTKFANSIDVTTGPSEYKEDARNYGTMIAPWGKFTVGNRFENIEYKESDNTNIVTLPGSFAYLTSFANSAQTNPNFYATAGVTRGIPPTLIETTLIVNGAQAEKVQPDKQDASNANGIAINPITRIDPYGYAIWGNRTLHFNTTELVASSFLNIRILSSDVKKLVRNAALKLNFEIKSEILWLNFKALISPELDKLIAKNGLEKYKLTQVDTNDRGKVKAIITLFCTYAVESWDIEIDLTDSYVTVE